MRIVRDGVSSVGIYISYNISQQLSDKASVYLRYVWSVYAQIIDFQANTVFIDINRDYITVMNIIYYML